MNVLLDKFPTKALIDGKVYELNTDFRSCLKIILAFEDEELFDDEKIEIMLLNLYGDNIPDNIEEAIRKALYFLDCGETEDENKVGNRKNATRLYSFTKDAKYIYSAIKQTHGIDLENIEYLHWWKFVYLFLDLNPECFFCKMVDLRNRKKKGKLNKEERRIYIQLYDILELDNKPQLTEEEQKKVDKFMSLLEEAERKEKEASTEKEVE